MKLKNSAAGIFRQNDMILTPEGNFGAELLQGGYDMRPNQLSAAQARRKWIIGDVTEVLDRNTWKLGKILNMLEDNYFVIRLADCIKLKEFHISSLRIPHASETPSKRFPVADKAPRRGKGQQPADYGALPRSRAVQQRGHKKRKAAADADASHHLSKRTLRPRQFSAAAADSYLHSPSQVRDEPAECSVASCSVNDPEHFGHGNRHAVISGLAASRFLNDDAMSACLGTSGREDEEDCHDNEPAAGVDVHGLELEAYRSTVRALHASGPLTWEQESLLTNLRLCLNISNEEHLLQLRRLLSSSSS